MSALTAEQRQLAEAYQTCFGDPQARLLVLEDLEAAASLMAEKDAAVGHGAGKLILHIMRRVSMLRRAKRVEGQMKKAKLEVING